MILILIIIGVIIYFYNFNNARKKETNKLSAKGGFRIQYKELIEYFQRIPNIQIEHQNATSITLCVNDKNVVTRFTMNHGFDDLTIFWNHNSLEFGKHSLNWNFSSNRVQSQIIKTVENDLENYRNKLLKEHGFEVKSKKLEKINLTNDILQVIEKTAKEIQNFLTSNKFNKGDFKPDSAYQIPRLLQFNSYIFAHMLTIDLIDNLQDSIKENFELIEFDLEFMNFMHTILLKIEPTEKELDELTKFSDHSRHDIWPSAYTSGIEILTEHKGILRTELGGTSSKMKSEYISVKEAFINKYKGGKGKYKLPYITYLSFFVYPLIFLESYDETTYNLKYDFDSEAFYFLSPYLQLIDDTQSFLKEEAYDVLKKNRISI